MSTAEHHQPDLEELAAYVDGRLTGESRTRVEELLLRDKDYYEIFLETVRFQHESSGPGEIVTHPGAEARRWPRWISGLIAASLLAVAGVSWWTRPPSIHGLAALLDGDDLLADRFGSEWEQPGWSRPMSGVPDFDSKTEEMIAFRLGVWTIQLEVSLGAADGAAAATIARQLATWSTEAGFHAASSAYAVLQQRIQESEDLASLSSNVSLAEAYLEEIFAQRDSEKQRFALGKWCEIGRLAALAKSPTPLQARSFQRFARMLPRAERLQAAEPLAAVEELLKKTELTDDNFGALREEFEEIIRTFAG